MTLDEAIKIDGLSCVYLIWIDGDPDSGYVGATKDLKLRLYKHTHRFRDNVHHSEQLQRSWNERGRECFNVQILEELESMDSAPQRERLWIDKLKKKGMKLFNKVLPLQAQRLAGMIKKTSVGISEELLKQMDELVERGTVYNRSVFIRNAIRRALKRYKNLEGVESERNN